MTRFELRRLETYDEASLLAEIRRVAAMIQSPVIAQREFNRLSKASSSVIRRRFGTWESALDKAGLAHRYSGAPVSRRLLAQARRTFADAELIEELQLMSAKVGADPLTMERFNQLSTRVNAETIQRRFGSWRKALDLAGLQIANRGKRYSENEYFENLLTVWVHHGRQPNYGEMQRAPSQIPPGAYEARWGTWRKALKAFIARVNEDLEAETSLASSAPEAVPLVVNSSQCRSQQQTSRSPSRPRPPQSESRAIRLGLRYDVLRRDRFCCVLCGRSPASQLACELHVDHIVPIARGGTNAPDNLRTLCASCNVGKGAKAE
jgi:5-methylcytosine-specific restriction endonuclease McrA